jgi:phosphoglycerate dehydrogenase-like enzyme
MAVAERVLLASVPTSEAAYARHHLPSAMVTPLPPSLALAAAHPEIEVLSVSSQDLVEPHVLARWSRLKAVVTRSNGTDHLPLEWLRAAGVSACHLGGYSTASVIEHTLALILALVRRIPEARESTQGRAPLWERARVAPRALAGLTVGILGTGRIGGGLARRLVAMEVKVVGHDLVCDPLLAASPGFRYADGLDDLLASAEVLTLHVPLTPLTRGLVDARHLAMLPTGALLVNTARGALVAPPTCSPGNHGRPTSSGSWATRA